MTAKILNRAKLTDKRYHACTLRGLDLLRKKWFRNSGQGGNSATNKPIKRLNPGSKLAI
jgi:hypothetical protein